MTSKRYMVFTYYQYDATGGMGDYWGSVNTEKEALEVIQSTERGSGKKGHYLDTHTGDVYGRYRHMMNVNL